MNERRILRKFTGFHLITRRYGGEAGPCPEQKEREDWRANYYFRYRRTPK
jgi:hypothetical protein